MTTRSVTPDCPVPLDGLACRVVIAGLLVLVLTSATMPPATAASASNPTAGAPATITTAAVTIAGAAGADHPAQSAPANPLDAARQAAERTQFRGTLSVQWVDGRGQHHTQLDVRGTGAAVYLDGPKAMVATPDERLVLQSSGWSLVAVGDPSAIGLAPPMNGKYLMSSQPGPLVANRPTTLVDIRTVLGTTDERLYLDDGTGLVLRREQFDGGAAVRVVAFTSIDIGAGSQELAPTVRHDDRPHQLEPFALAAPYRAPRQLAAGYVLVSVLRRQGVVQAVYSDAVHTLSVFEQGGALDVGGLPGAGEIVAIGAERGVRYSWPGGQLVTWQSGPLMYTAVGDGPVADVLAVAKSFPAAKSPSALQRVRLTSRRLLEDLTGRG